MQKRLHEVIVWLSFSACLAAGVLWIRSYRHVDEVYVAGWSNVAAVISRPHCVGFEFLRGVVSPESKMHFEAASHEIDDYDFAWRTENLSDPPRLHHGF